MAELEFKINYEPRDWSLPVLRSRARFRWVAGGRRLGKTYLLAIEAMWSVASRAAARHELFRRLGRHQETYEIWVVAPTYTILQKDWRVFKSACPSMWYRARESEPKQLYFPEFDARVTFMSAAHPEDLVAEGLDALLMDETGLVEEEAWLTVRPGLSERQGWLLAVGRPRGAEHWFYEEWKKGLPGAPERRAGEYESWRFDSICNPDFPREEWERARRQYPASWFDQEFRGDFVSAGAGVFRDPARCMTRATLREPVRDAEGRVAESGCVMGVDVGQHKAHTSLVVLDAGRDVVEIRQWSGDTTTERKQRLLAEARRWNARVVLDDTGLGHEVYHELTSAGVTVLPIRFTTEVKEALIIALNEALEEGQLHFGPKGNSWVDALAREIRGYRMRMMRSGRIVYEPPRGQTCDLLTALMLANWGWRSGFAGRAADVGVEPAPTGRSGPVGRLRLRRREAVLRMRLGRVAARVRGERELTALSNDGLAGERRAPMPRCDGVVKQRKLDCSVSDGRAPDAK